jgi:hypothetical protein
MSEANPERGEVPILLNGRAYPMRPSYTAVEAIERALGPVVALGSRMTDPMHRLKVSEMSIIVAESIKAAGKDRNDKMLQAMKADKIAELIYEQGIVSVLDPILILLVNMVSGGGKAKKKPEENESTNDSITES